MFLLLTIYTQTLREEAKGTLTSPALMPSWLLDGDHTVPFETPRKLPLV